MKPGQQDAAQAAEEGPLEDGLGLARAEARALGGRDARPTSPVGGAEEQLPPVPAPARAGRRPPSEICHLPPPSGKRRHEHLELAGLVRLVGDEAAVGREVRAALLVGVLQEGLRLALAVGREQPEVGPPFCARGLDRGCACRPADQECGAGKGELAGREQPLGLAGPVGALPEDCRPSRRPRTRRRSTSVGRPDRVGVVALAEGHARGDVALEVVDPDVPVVVAQQRNGEPPAVGREARGAVDARLAATAAGCGPAGPPRRSGTAQTSTTSSR